MELSLNPIENRIHTIRGIQVMLDSDLAVLYSVETKWINEQVKRNARRFPERFMFQVTQEGRAHLQSQIATANPSYIEKGAVNRNSRNVLPATVFQRIGEASPDLKFQIGTSSSEHDIPSYSSEEIN
jgi:hypothetical protein